MLEQSKIGIPIWGKVISALLFVDDLVLIGQNKRMVEELLLKCQTQFELCGLEINCSKSNILSRESVIDGKINLSTDNGSLLGDIEVSQKYKYLGVTIGLGRTSDIFKQQRITIVSRLRSYAGLILSLARESFDPIEVGEALWKSVALESILHGIQVISVWVGGHSYSVI